MLARFLLLCCLSLLVSACATSFKTPNATGHYAYRTVQCVPYARSKSRVALYGDAYSWWDQAASRYPRGHVPEPGAVLVLARTSRMTHGHVAVVRRVIGPREIDVTHSNWGSGWYDRRIVYDLVRAQDVSVANDWTLVRFWNYRSGNPGSGYGFPYGAKGFIYADR